MQFFHVTTKYFGRNSLPAKSVEKKLAVLCPAQKGQLKRLSCRKEFDEQTLLSRRKHAEGVEKRLALDRAED